jgi:hypothetical protein
VTAGDRDRQRGNQQPWAGNDPLVDRIADGDSRRSLAPSLSTSRSVVNPASRSFLAAATP